MIGKTVSHYRITEQIGSGGMGVVYKAEDTKLKRTVALKFLPPELTRDPAAKKRFIREAQAASALEHPNICNIHEIDETDDGQMFIVMACYEGKTLKDKIIPQGMAGVKDERLKTEEAIDIAIQIAEGLAKAHENGIVHRDIKPANIFITNDGQVKILDFGLAKLAGQAQLTKDSSTLGTVAYMSPEQCSGREVDHQTDIWSLGVVLYEMLTGELPFPGDYEQAMIYAILNEEPKSLEGISVKLESPVKKALHKNPDERFASVAELLDDLTAIRGNTANNSPQKSTKNIRKKAIIISVGAVLILIAAIAAIFSLPTSEPEESIKSLAVLPFTNLKNDPQTDYLGNDLIADIIKDLSYLQNLNILPFSFVHDLKAGTKLHTEYILAGNYLKEKETIRLNLELIKNSSQEIIWNDTIEERYETAFKLQDRVSDRIIKELRIEFAPEEKKRMRKDVPNNPLAYEYYLKALDYPYTIEHSKLAIKMLEKSYQLDSIFVPTLVELAYYNTRTAQYVLDGSDEYLIAQKYLFKALELNKEDFYAMNYLAAFFIETGNSEKAMEFLNRAASINPNSAWIHFRFSYIYRYAGMNLKSAESIEKALNLLPNERRFRSVTMTYKYLLDYENAMDKIKLDPDNPNMIAMKAEIFFRMGKIDSSLNYYDKAIKRDSINYSGIYSAAMIKYIQGEKDQSYRYLMEIEKSLPYDAEIKYEVASTYGLIGKKSDCVRALRLAIKGGFFNHPFMLQDPFLDPVRDDPEFQELLALAKGKHETFKQKYFAEEE